MAITKTEISKLYVAIFNRAGEGSGNQYWKSTELTFIDMATEMLNTTDAQEYFGSALDSNKAFIEHIYLNTLNKTYEEDTAGVDYWTGLLDSGTTRGEVVSGLVQAIETYSPEGTNYDAQNVKTVSAYNQFANRVEVSDYTADNLQDVPDNYKVVLGFAEDLSVTYEASSVESAKNKINTLVGGENYFNTTTIDGNGGSDQVYTHPDMNSGDIITFPDVGTISIVNRDLDDGKVILTWNDGTPDNNATITIEDIDPSDDINIYNVNQFNVIYGEGTIVSTAINATQDEVFIA